MKFRYILTIAAICSSLVACNEKEFLDVKPQGALSDAVMNSVEGLPYLLNSAYSALAGPSPTFGAMNSPVNHWLQGELRSDNAYKGGGGPSDNTNYHMLETLTIDATHATVPNFWTNLYQSIKRTNSTLQVLNTVTEEEVPEVEIYKAEMRALRAHYYFQLSRYFNQIVWIDENDSELDYPTMRNDEYTRDEILGMIANEFEEVADILPDKFKDYGRVNKWVAKAYAAKVYLYKAYRQNPADHSVTSVDPDDLDKVIALTGEVMSSPNGYALLDDYQQLDMVDYENGKESLFAIQYSMNDGATLSLPWAYCGVGHVNWSATLNTPKGPYNGDDFFKSSQDLVNSYQTGPDGLPLLDGQWQTKDYDVVVETTNADGSKTYTNTQIDSPVDPRIDFTIGRINVRWKTYEVEPVTELWYRDFNSYGYHFVKRFLVSPDSGYLANTYPWGNSPLNYQIIRYAHVLLWRAEALVERGRHDEARELINMIRNRAKNSEYVKAWEDKVNYPSAIDINGYAGNYVINEYPAAGWDQDYARKAVRYEYRLECALEGERFFDLVRWGVAAETMNRFFELEKDERVYYQGVKFEKGKHEYFPIPLAQYNLTGVYVQNPGYGSFE